LLGARAPRFKVQKTGTTLGKLLSLKQWVTVAAAARQISIVCDDEADESDVLQLALEGRLKLSVNFVNHAKARMGKIVPEDEAPTYWGFLSEQEISSGIPLGDGTVLVLDDEIVTIEGIWDLFMKGSERLDVEHAYHRLTNGPTVDLQCFDGAFVTRPDGSICQLQDHFKEGNDGILKGTSYYPAFGLPLDSVLVVRTKALIEFEQEISGVQANIEKPLSATERNTLLVMIAALCKKSGIAPQDRTSASQVARLVDDIGGSVSDETIRKALKQIPDAVARRGK